MNERGSPERSDASDEDAAAQLAGLSGREFEAWVKVLLERHLECEVVDRPHTGDEGRDLVVHHPDGDIVVECKHTPDGAVGRPVLQKLHSAVLTGRTDRGMVVTTGRLTGTAREYAEAVSDVELQLVDGARLAYLAETVGLSGTTEETAEAVPTLPGDRLARAVRRRVIGPRMTVGEGHDLTLEISRSTRYEGYYLADFRAGGSLDTAVGEQHARWRGRAWCRHDGARAGVGDPPVLALPDTAGGHRPPTVPLAEALAAVPGPAEPPGIGPHQAVRTIRDHLTSSLTRTIRYTGRNNQTYTRNIVPGASDTHVSDVRLVFVPRQRLRISGAGRTTADARLRERPTATGEGTVLWLWSDSLGVCRTCRRGVGDDDHVLCPVCLRAAHRPGLVAADSVTCNACDGLVCRPDARRGDDGIVCVRCAGAGARSLPPRWRPHALIAGAVTVVAAVLGVLVGAGAGGIAAAAAVGAWAVTAAAASTGEGTPDGWLAHPPVTSRGPPPPPIS